MLVNSWPWGDNLSRTMRNYRVIFEWTHHPFKLLKLQMRSMCEPNKGLHKYGLVYIAQHGLRIPDEPNWSRNWSCCRGKFGSSVHIQNTKLVLTKTVRYLNHSVIHNHFTEVERKPFPSDANSVSLDRSLSMPVKHTVSIHEFHRFPAPITGFFIVVLIEKRPLFCHGWHLLHRKTNRVVQCGPEEQSTCWLAFENSALVSKITGNQPVNWLWSLAKFGQDECENCHWDGKFPQGETVH